jgi:hypothetical protein
MNVFAVSFQPAITSDGRVLLAAVAAYLGRYRGQSRLHTESDLKIFLTWCTDQGLDPLRLGRVDIERYVRWFARGPQWILNRELDIAVALERAIRMSPWGLPTASPEVVLFFKAGGNRSAAEMRTVKNVRRRDEEDFFALLPVLTAEQRSWLRESLAKLQPEHPWSTHLAS